jgi:predicted phage tail component-like protein
MTTPVSITLGGTALGSACPEFRVRDINRGLLGERRDEYVQVPGRPGSWLYTEEPGDRVIVIEGIMRADGTAARRSAMRSLARWAQTDGTAQMIFGDEPDRFYAVTLADAPDVNEVLRYGEVELEFRADPYPLSTSLSTETIAVSGSPDSGTFAVSDDIGAYPVIEITPTNGTITSFTLTVNGFQLAWSGTLLEDETLTISSVSFTVTAGQNGDTMLTGAFDPNLLEMSDVIGEFPELVPGTNDWSLSWVGTATTVTVEVTWRERFF